MESVDGDERRKEKLLNARGASSIQNSAFFWLRKSHQLPFQTRNLLAAYQINK